MNVDKILKEIETVSTDLEKLILSFNDDAFNKKPDAQTWSAAEISEHLLLAVGADLLYGTTKQPGRDAAMKVPEVAAVFLDFETKMQSPDFIKPTGKKMNVVTTASEIKNQWKRIVLAVSELDLSAVCTDFSIPSLGEMTRLEWVYLFIYHTQRHTRQMAQLKTA